MGWIIFAVYMVLGIGINISIAMEKNADTARGKKIAKYVGMTFMWIALGIVLIGLLFVVGWIWYYICGGFLIECEDSFFGKAVWGLATLIFLGFILGFIAILFGYNPK